MGTETIRPVDDTSTTYISIFRFDGYSHLEAWMWSDDRLRHMKQAKAFSEKAPHVSQYHSLEFMFPVDDVTGKPPSREKMAVVTLLGLIAPVYYVPPW